MFDSCEWGSTDDFCRVDELVDVDNAVGPARAIRDGTIQEPHNVYVLFDRCHQLAEIACPLPSSSAVNDIGIIGPFDGSSDSQRATPEDGATIVGKPE